MNYSSMDKNNDLIRVVVVDKDHDIVVKSTQALMATQRVEIAGETTTYSIACSIIDRHQPEFVVVGIDEVKLQIIEKIRSRFPSIRIIAVGDNIMGDDGNADLIIKCFRSGSDEFLQRPLLAEDLNSVFDRLRTRKKIDEPVHSANGKVLAFLGSSGGCGTSFLSLNFAHLLAENHKTVIVDFHFSQGDLSVHCNLQPAFSLRDLGETDEPMDHALIDSITQEHSDGLRMIFQPYDCQPFVFHFEHIQTLINLLKQRYEYIILDMGVDLERSLDCLELVDEWFLVLKQELSSVFMASRKLQRFLQVDVQAQSLKLIVNACGKNDAVSLSRIAKALSRKDLTSIRNDEKTVLSAMNQGQPLHKISSWSKAYKDLRKMVDKWKKNEEVDPVQVNEKKQNELATMFKTQYADKVI